MAWPRIWLSRGVKWAWKQRKWIDLWGNDWYLAHIVRTLRWWTDPTHVSVLGDLLGSQWVGDEEFVRRGNRFWGTVMRGMERVPEHIMSGDGENENEQDGDGETEKKKKWGGTREVLGADPSWKNRVINIAGNHDIGYAGDIDGSRIERFERDFGRVNWDIVFTLPNTSTTSSSEPPQLRLVILNSMNLDTPVWTPPSPNRNLRLHEPRSRHVPPRNLQNAFDHSPHAYSVAQTRRHMRGQSTLHLL